MSAMGGNRPSLEQYDADGERHGYGVYAEARFVGLLMITLLLLAAVLATGPLFFLFLATVGSIKLLVALAMLIFAAAVIFGLLVAAGNP
jgi:hypothetical protein